MTSSGLSTAGEPLIADLLEAHAREIEAFAATSTVKDEALRQIAWQLAPIGGGVVSDQGVKDAREIARAALLVEGGGEQQDPGAQAPTSRSPQSGEQS